MTRARHARALIAGAGLGATLGCCSCPDERADDDETGGGAPTLPFEPLPEITVVEDLPDPLWARQLARLPSSARHVVLVNPEKLRGSLRSGVLRDRLTGALSGFGGSLALMAIEGALDDVDTSLPIAIAAFAMPNERALADARFGAVTDPELVPAFLHHRVLIPTRDAVGLLAALTPAVDALGLTPFPLPPEFANRLPAGARLLARNRPHSTPELAIMILPDPRELRLEILWGGHTDRHHYTAALLRVASPPNEQAWLETPAVRHLLVERALVGLLENPEGAASGALGLALAEASRAVRTSASDLLPVTWTRGLAIALVGYDILDPRDRIEADTALTLELDRELSVRTTTSLSASGAVLADRSLPFSGHVFDPRSEPGRPPSLVLQSGESMRASTAESEPLRFGRQLPRETLRERWAWSSALAGASAVAHARWPTLRTLARVLDPEALDLAGVLPDAFTVVVPGPTDAGELRLALALDYGAQVDGVATRTAIMGLPWPDEQPPTVSSQEVGGRTLVLVGIGIDANELIDIEHPRRPGRVERVHIRRSQAGVPILPPVWAEWFETIGPAWAAWADVVGGADWVRAHRGATLVGHASIAIENGQAPGPVQLKAFGSRTPEPVVVVEDGRGWQCLRDIPHIAVQALVTVADAYSTPSSRLATSLGAEPPNLGALATLADGEDEPSRARRTAAGEALAAAWASVEPLLACADADGPSQPTARRVRAEWLTALAEWADRIPDAERALQWARDGCSLGSERACTHIEAMRLRTSVAIPVHPWLSYPLLGVPALEIVVGTRSIALEGRILPDAGELDLALAECRSERHGPGRDVAVYADVGVAYADLRALARTILGHGLVPRVVVRDMLGREMALEIVDETELLRREGTSPRLVQMSPGRDALVREPGAHPQLRRVSRVTTWGQLSEALLEFGALPTNPTPGQQARHRAVGSAATVPALALG